MRWFLSALEQLRLVQVVQTEFPLTNPYSEYAPIEITNIIHVLESDTGKREQLETLDALHNFNFWELVDAAHRIIEGK